MKKIFLISLGLAMLAVSAAAQSITVSNSLTYQNINNITTNGQSCIIGTATVSGKGGIQMQIQNGGLTAPTALAGQFQISLDNANWTTVYTYAPAATNATIDSPKVPISSFTVYGRVVLTTTNSVNAGASILLAPLF